MLSGGVDIDPARYGAEPGPDHDPPDPRRDEVEFALFEEALDRDVPVLAICRGLQLVNVALGGTPHRHLATHPAGTDHPVVVEPGSLLAALHGPGLTANSLHHQGVDRPGAGLAITGRAPDGVVEAVELTGRAVLGVQWHPEQTPGPQPVFGWLADAARARAAVR